MSDLENIPPPSSYATSKALYMGPNVGIKDDPTSSGTIGGHAILTRGRKKHHIGVTNCHVVSTEKKGQGMSPILSYICC